MTGMKKRRRSRPWMDEVEELEGVPAVWISSAPRTAEGRAAGVEVGCVISWGDLEWRVGAVSVMRTAGDLMTAAAYADMITELLAEDFGPAEVTAMLTQMLASALGERKPVMGGMLGDEETVGVMPGGSSERKAGLVMLRRGKLGGALTSAGARQMANHWVEAAVVARQDELVKMALEDMLSPEAGDRASVVLDYMGSMRDLGSSDLEEFRSAERDRARRMFGQ